MNVGLTDQAFRDFLGYNSEWRENLAPSYEQGQAWVLDEQPRREDIISRLHPYALGHALVYASMAGDIAFVQDLMELRGPFPTDFNVCEHTRRHTLNGEPIHFGMVTSYFNRAPSAEHLKALLETIPAIGLAWLTGAMGNRHSLLWDAQRLERIELMLSKLQPFDGQLPDLDESGVIQNPQLIQGLDETMKSSHYPEGYAQVLCWVHPSQLDRTDLSLTPYIEQHCLNTNEHGTTQYIGLDEIDKLDMPHIDQMVMNQGQSSGAGTLRTFSVSLGIHPSSIANYTIDDVITLSNLASRSLQYGFGLKQDRILCRARVDQMMQQPHADAPPDPHVSGFLSGYFPMTTIARRYGKSQEMERHGLPFTLGIFQAQPRFVAGRILSALEMGDDIKHPMKKLITRPIASLAARLSYALVPKDMVALQNEFGVDNRQTAVVLNAGKINQLYQSGYQFSHDTMLIVNKTARRVGVNDPEYQYTRIVINQDDRMSDHDYDGMIRETVSMGLWPSNEDPRDPDIDAKKLNIKPASLSDALKVAARYKSIGRLNTQEGSKPEKRDAHKAAIVALLQLAGPEECAKNASSPAQWRTLRMVFSSEQLEPHLGYASSRAQRDFLADDLGL